MIDNAASLASRSSGSNFAIRVSAGQLASMSRDPRRSIRVERSDRSASPNPSRTSRTSGGSVGSVQWRISSRIKYSAAISISMSSLRRAARNGSNACNPNSRRRRPASRRTIGLSSPRSVTRASMAEPSSDTADAGRRITTMPPANHNIHVRHRDGRQEGCTRPDTKMGVGETFEWRQGYRRSAALIPVDRWQYIGRRFEECVRHATLDAGRDAATATSPPANTRTRTYRAPA